MTREQIDALVKFRIEKANVTLAEVESLMQNNFWNTAANRLYYSCFYAVSALLAHNEIFAKTHKGTLQQFHLNFVKLTN